VFLLLKILPIASIDSLNHPLEHIPLSNKDTMHPNKEKKIISSFFCSNFISFLKKQVERRATKKQKNEEENEIRTWKE
jgi:hypothetical protein